MAKIEKFITRYWIIIILICSIPAVWALFVKGYFGASDDLHIAWLYELDKTLRLGQFPPRFVPDLSFGFGYPLFNFVFPLPFYLGEIFHFYGLSLVDSIKAVFFISIPVSGLFMYLLLRQFTKVSFSLTGAVLYIYAPYRAVDLYVRGAIGEIVSFIFLPLIILSIIRISQEKSLKWVGIGGLSLASLILSHNITAYMFSPFICVFFLLQTFFSNSKKQFIIKFFVMVFLALLISLYFWLPAIVESRLMKYDTVFNFADHFPTLFQLITPYWGYGASLPGPYDGMSFFLGAVHLAVFLIGSIFTLVFWKRFKKEQRIILSWSVICLIWAIFLMNHRSVFLWANLPMLPYFQFPWRFLILTTFAIPIFTIVFEKLPFSRFSPAVLMLLTIVTTGSFFRPEHFLGRMDDYYLNRYIPTPTASSEYLKIQEEYLRLPKATEIRPDKNYPLLFPDTGIKRVDKYHDLKVAFEFEGTSSSLINLNKYNFPGWQAKIDGVKQQILTGKPYGQVSIFVPEGSHKVEVYYHETSFRNLLNFASLGVFLVSLIMILI